MLKRPLLLLLLCVLAVHTADEDDEFEDIEFIDTEKERAKTVTKEEYCASCPDPEKPHSLCAYQGVSKDCVGGDGITGVTDDDKKLIVDLHNELRDKVASGAETRGYNNVGQPSAKDMVKLVWDEQLAMVAQHWADQCTFEHDKCRNDPRFNYSGDPGVGQNLALKSKSRCVAPDWDGFILAWYNEVDNMQREIVEDFGPVQNGGVIGHYTTLVNGQSSNIGCGYRTYNTNGLCDHLYVCHYGPGANYVGSPVYKIGTPRASCPDTPKDEKYPNLCLSLLYDEYGLYDEFPESDE